MNNLQWITDRLPIEADAHPISKNVMIWHKLAGPVSWGYHKLPTNRDDIIGWLPLNNLPPVPVKTQEDKDWDLWFAFPSNDSQYVFKENVIRFANAVRADLRKQLREHIEKCPPLHNPELLTWWNGLRALEAEEG